MSNMHTTRLWPFHCISSLLSDQRFLDNSFSSSEAYSLSAIQKSRGHWDRNCKRGISWTPRDGMPAAQKRGTAAQQAEASASAHPLRASLKKARTVAGAAHLLSPSSIVQLLSLSGHGDLWNRHRNCQCCKQAPRRLLRCWVVRRPNRPSPDMRTR